MLASRADFKLLVHREHRVPWIHTKESRKKPDSHYSDPLAMDGGGLRILKL